MSTTKAISASLLMAVISFLAFQGGCKARVIFADRDIRASEDSSHAQVTLRLDGDSGSTETVLVLVPLTVAQYRNQTNRYDGICDSIIAAAGTIDQAEEEDFDQDPLTETITPNAMSEGLQEIQFSIPITNDNIQEPSEFFLLVLEVHRNDSYTSDDSESGRCMRIYITDDDNLEVALELLSPIVEEDAGQVEVFRVVKRGQTEQTVTIALYVLPGFSDVFTGFPNSLTLDKDQESTTVSVNITDDLFPEDNERFTVSGSFVFASSGRRQELQNSISFTIRDNDFALIGFEREEVTVVEGDTAFLGIVLKNRLLTSHDYHRWNSGFTASVGLGVGNATAQVHFSNASKKNYYPGDIIKISTIDDKELERPRWFQVRLIEQHHHQLNILITSIVRVTIRDNDGTPNRPKIDKVTFNRGSIALSWTIERHELRPVQGYTITLQETESETVVYKPRQRREGNGRKKKEAEEEKARHVNLTNFHDNCRSVPLSMDYKCEHTLQEKVDPGKMYNITLCAVNEFGTTCGHVREAADNLSASTEGLLGQEEQGDSAALVTTLWSVIGVLLAILFCCTLLCCLAFCSATVVLARKQRHKERVLKDPERYKKIISLSMNSIASTDV